MGDNDSDSQLPQLRGGGACYEGVVQTPFATGKNMDQMQAMVANARPETVVSVANAWKRVSDMLVTGGDSVKATFDQAVDHIMQHWEGDAANGFHAKAKKISQSITDTSTYARYTSVAMKNAGETLKQIQPEVMAMQKPSSTSSALDYAKDLGDRSEAWKSQIKNNQGAQRALDADSGSLSAGKEAQLRMAAKMETLAATYTSQSAAMDTWKPPIVGQLDHGEDYPGPPGGVPPVVMPIMPVVANPGNTATSSSAGRAIGTGSTKTGSFSSPEVPRDEGISGGAQGTLTSHKPTIGTSVDGITGGLGGGSRMGSGTAAIGTGGSIHGVGGAVGSGGATAGSPGASAGFGAATGSSMGGAAGGPKGGSAAMGRGLPGANGLARGKAGVEGEAGATRGGSLARMRGGVVGEAEEGASGKGNAQGGSGLHQSRGAGGKEQAGTNRKGVMAGRGADTRSQEKERREGDRPDYLVEDEETWVPQHDVAPKVIE